MCMNVYKWFIERSFVRTHTGPSNLKYSHLIFSIFSSLCSLLSCSTSTPSFLLLGLKENSIDSLVFDTLIPKPIIQRYLNLLMEHRRIILSGPSGTGKSFMAAKLAEFIISQMGQKVTEHNLASFNVDQNSSKVGRVQMFNVADRVFKHCQDFWCSVGVICCHFLHSDVFTLTQPSLSTSHDVCM